MIKILKFDPVDRLWGFEKFIHTICPATMTDHDCLITF